MHKQFPQHSGFAFGLLTFALFIGYMPILLGVTKIDLIVMMVLVALSLLLLILSGFVIENEGRE